ncbi:MAG: heavy-metal-associated domain-containing protein [Lentisphaerae bacterium]|nr:heavy-metal-associated domain-containing protein [Lentisphaerota bacterium]
MRIYWGVLLLVCLALGACRRQDMRTVVIRVPGLTNAASTKIIQDAFLYQPGIQSIRPDIDKRELVITYNSMVVALKNLEFTIASAGFEANDIPAFTNAIIPLPTHP